MENEFILEGKNVEEVIEDFLKSKNIQRNEIEYEVLDDGTPGLFGLVGYKKARVRIKLKRTEEESAENLIKEILKKMGFDVKLDTIREEERTFINILTEDDSSLLIGKRGKTLSALQYIINTILSIKMGTSKRVILDVGNYREKRNESLKRLAEDVARKVKSSGRAIKLEPMSPGDRKYLHIYLSEIKGVTTKSIGEGHRRRIIVIPQEKVY
ncbi:MAG: RNA-binding cell elongation regulator Jag/EloR [Candidatus Hydrogenedentota bacterium]